MSQRTVCLLVQFLDLSRNRAGGFRITLWGSKEIGSLLVAL
jgi:hypothetical protein